MHPSPLRAAATAVLTAVLLLAAAAPAEAAPATVAVRGVVTVDGAPVPGALVGAYGAGNGLLAKGRTDADGTFALRTPSGVPALVVVGRNPRNEHAVFAAGGQHLVVGVIGGAAPAGRPAALFEQVRRVTPARLGGGRPLRFRLERAGRLRSPAPAGGTGRIRLARDPGASGWTAVDGVTTSDWLVPDAYDLAWEPDATHLARTTRVRIGSGTTAIAAPALRRGTTVRLQLLAGGAPAPAGVRVTDGTGFVRTSDAQGRVVVEGVAPGTHRFTAGTTAREANTTGAPADGFLPVAVTVRAGAGAGAGQEAVDVDVALTPAASITGTVTARGSARVRLVAQDAEGDAVSATEVVGGGRFALGGLPAGTWTVVADDLERHVHDRLLVTVAQGAAAETPRALVPAIADPVVSGRVIGGRKAHVALSSGGADIGIATWLSPRYSSSYRVAVPPGRYVARARSDRALEPTGVRLTVSGSRRQDLRSGAARSYAGARFTVNGHAVSPGIQAVSPTGDVLVFGGRRGGSTLGTLERHHWRSTRGTAPAVDGPWSFVPPEGAFRLRDRRVTDIGTWAVSIRR